MNHLIVYAHPSADSFNHAIVERSVAALSFSGVCDVVDLYAEHFDPVRSPQEHAASSVPPDVQASQRRIEWADHLLFIFPIWWYDRPAILKGWCDRVLSYGFAYRFDPELGTPVGLLHDKVATVVATSGLIDADDPGLEWALRSLATGTLAFCGIADTRCLPLFCVPRVSAQARTQMLATVDEFLRSRDWKPEKTAMNESTNEPENIQAFYATTMAEVPPVIMQWYLTLNQRDAKGLRATMTDDFTFHSPLGDFDSPQGYVDMVGKFGGWVQTKRFISEGTTIVHEFVYHMTDPGVADIPILEIFELRDGLIRASNVYNNPADFPQP